MEFEIDFDLMRKVKENDGTCLCSLVSCPCENFLETKECRCGVYKLPQKP